MGYVQAKHTYHTRLDGKRVRVRKDDVRSEDDPLVKRAPDRYKPLDVPKSGGGRRSTESGAVETADATPGRRRTRSQAPAKKAAAAQVDEKKSGEEADKAEQ